jgi:hypothetical protein
VPKNINNSPAEPNGGAEKREKIRPFDLPRFKRWFGIPPFVNEQGEKDFDEYVLSFKSYLDPMDSLIAKLVYEYALEKYKMIQLLNMSAERVKQQASQFKHLEQSAARDREDLDRKGIPTGTAQPSCGNSLPIPPSPYRLFQLFQQILPKLSCTRRTENKAT